MNANQDALARLFERIETFFRRLELYTEVSPTAAMTEIIVKIIVEVFTILALATKETKRRRFSEWIHGNGLSLANVSLEKYLKRLVGRNDIEGALKRLDDLTQEEARMATVELLKITHGINAKAKELIDGTQLTLPSRPWIPNAFIWPSNFNVATHSG
jgi:uncharacterized membrane protein YcjF (UPF0283 family)